MSTPDYKRIRALADQILQFVEAQQQNPAEGYCACWAAFARITAAAYGDDVARQIRDVIRTAAQQQNLDFLSSLPPPGEA
jgi:hypothetical protein